MRGECELLHSSSHIIHAEGAAHIAWRELTASVCRCTPLDTFISLQAYFGTVESWLIYQLTGGLNGGIHVTDGKPGPSFKGAGGCGVVGKHTELGC